MFPNFPNGDSLRNLIIPANVPAPEPEPEPEPEQVVEEPLVE